MTPARELAEYLAAEGVGELAGADAWAIQYSRMSETPDDAICLYDSGGQEPLAYDVELRSPNVEIRVRGTDFEAVSDKQQEIFDLLTQPDTNPPAAIEAGEGLYIGIWLESDFIDLGRDDNDRFRISSNYRCNRQPLEVIS